MAVSTDPAFNPIGSTSNPQAPPDSSLSAKNLIADALRYFGLESLADWAWNLHLTTGAEIPEIMIEIRNRPEYKARFPAMAELAASGRAIDEGSYIDYENSVRTLLQRYGYPQGMYDTPQGIANLLLKDVSAAEVNERLTIAAAATYDYPPEVRARLRQEFGAGPGDLAAYMMDPDKALPLIQRQVRVSQVYGAADQQQVNIDEATAARLAENGITFEQARQGFGQVAATTQLGAGYGETIAQGDRIAGAFGDAEAQRKQKRVQRSRQAGFAGGGSAAETQQGVSGLGGSSTQ